MALPVIVPRLCGVEAPSLVQFGAAKPGESVSKRVVLRSSDGRKFKLRAEAGGAFSAAVPGEAKLLAVVTVTYSPTAAGKSAGEVVLRTDHPDSPEVRIAAAGVCGATP